MVVDENYDDLSARIEEVKNEGNGHFQKSRFQEAIQMYSKGIVMCDERGETGEKDSNIKVTLLSNRAACLLKAGNFEKCDKDCTDALNLLMQDDAIRCKLLYRRAKARFLLTEVGNNASSKNKTRLQDAAKDLLQLLSIDAKNVPGATLLRTIRAKHDLTKGTPISQTLDFLRDATNKEDQIEQCNILLGLITNDDSMAVELGQRQGIRLLLDDLGFAKPIAVLSCCCSNPKFVQAYGKDISQKRLHELIHNSNSEEDLVMPCLSIWLRLVLYLDPLDSLDKTSFINQNLLIQSCRATFSHPALLPATLDVLSTWTTLSREDVVRSSTLSQNCFFSPPSDAELRRMKPREVAGIKKDQYERLMRDKEWAKQRAIYICKEGALKELMEQSIQRNHLSFSVRKQVGLVIGRILSSIQDEEDTKKVVEPFIVSKFEIEEVLEEKAESDISRERLDLLIMRAFLVTSLLFGRPETAAWALKQIEDDISELICSYDSTAMAIASELVSAAASNEKARPHIATLFVNGTLQRLVDHPERSIRSGAASAIAKLGLASDSKNAEDEENIMELLKIAAELLNDSEEIDEEEFDSLEFRTKKSLNLNAKSSPLEKVATTSIERGIEVLGYLASKTNVKDELAHGYKSFLDSPKTALQRLVDLASVSGAGESISAYALATIFSLIAVSNETLRREAFEGKQISMEQYDELQSLGKTEEEKQAAPTKEPDDSPEAVIERIQKLANLNVPQAMVKLMKGATDATTEALVTGLNRMANEASVRGLLIQQGVLSACIKIEDDKQSTKNAAESKSKKIAQHARHCAARLLITTNPSFLTTSQRMGAIKPMIQLIRDSDASDLQHFESLLAVTNLASTGQDAKEKIISEKGIHTLSYAMFSSHELVRRAATEAMCNLIPHPAMMKHLADAENLKLWLAFSAEYEENFECARAALGCLAMSTYLQDIAEALVGLEAFKESVTAILKSGNLELMHRAFVMIQNLMGQGEKCKEKIEEAGLLAFCLAYVQSYHDGSKATDLQFSPEQQGLMSATVDLAKEICSDS